MSKKSKQNRPQTGSKDQNKHTAADSQSCPQNEAKNQTANKNNSDCG